MKYVFSLYEKYQTDAPLTSEERSTLDGHDYQRNKEELAEGERRLQEYKVQTKQLTDCSVCHR